MAAYQSPPEPEVAPAEDSLNLSAVQIVDVVSRVVHDLDESGQRVHIVMERAPTIIADSKKLADVTASLLRSALESAPNSGPVEVEIAARCLARSHETAPSGGEDQACEAPVSVAIRDYSVDAEQPARTLTHVRKVGADFESAFISAQNIVRLHKGRLWITTRAERGRTLGFCLNSEQAA